MKDFYINWFLKILLIVIIIAITVILDKFVFLAGGELLWLICGFLCWSIWDSEVE